MCLPTHVSWVLGGEFHLHLHPSSISPSLVSLVNWKPELPPHKVTKLASLLVQGVLYPQSLKRSELGREEGAQ